MAWSSLFILTPVGKSFGHFKENGREKHKSQLLCFPSLTDLKTYENQQLILRMYRLKCLDLQRNIHLVAVLHSNTEVTRKIVQIYC